MKLLRSLALWLTLPIAIAAHAQTNRAHVEGTATINNIDKAGQIGVGLQVGSLSGVTIDYWHNAYASWNAGVLADRGNTAVALAHNWMLGGVFSEGHSAFVPYVGVGVLAAFGNHSDYFSDRTQTFAMAAQVPLGFQFLPLQERFGIFAELQPSLEVTPALVGFLNADLGARFYF